MAKKLKDYYDLDYIHFLGNLIKSAHKNFDRALFINECKDKIEDLEFSQRQTLLAQTLRKSLDLNYRDTIGLFTSILGPELPNNAGNFSKGYWLWPLGRYVELYGTEDLDTSLDFSKELTKRFTSEYCMRPLIASDPEKVIPIIVQWSLDPNMRIRRLSSECVRISLPWAKKSTIVLDYWQDYKEILSNLKNDKDKYVMKSVANNLNDLSKHDLNLFWEIVDEWQGQDMSLQSQWIIKHGSRSLDKL